MASRLYSCMCVFLVIILCINEGQTALLTVSPQQISVSGQSPTPTLTVTCTPDATGITTVISIEIGKKSSAGAKSVIVELLSGDPIVVVDSSLQQRMTKTGSITGATGSLQIDLSQLQNSDAATYYCVTSFSAGAGVSTDETTATVTIQTTSDPGTTEGTSASATESTEEPTQTGTMPATTSATNVTGSTETTNSAATATVAWALIPFLLLLKQA